MKIKQLIQSIEKTVNELFLYPSNKNVISNGSIRNKITQYREITNNIEIIKPKYKVDQLGILTNKEYNTFVLKNRLNSINVTDDERRLLTLRGCYYNYKIDNDLLLIDEKLIRYFNYYESTTEMKNVDKIEVEKYRIKRNVSCDSDSLLGFFSEVVLCYEKMIKQEIILPFDFFIHRALIDINNLYSPNLNQLTDSSYYVRQMLAAYSILFNEPIPEDYFIIDENTSTNVYFIEMCLNNKIIEPTNPQTAKPFLSIVK